MSKSTNLNSGFLISYDWLPALESLSAEDLQSLLFALIRRQKDGEPLPNFPSKMVDIYARMIEPTIKRRLDGQAGGNKATEAYINYNAHDTAIGTTAVSTPVSTVDAGVASKVKQNKAEQSEVECKDTPNPPKGAEVFAERFEEFWKAYPKKVGKGAAEKSFKKIKPSGDLLQKMLDAIEAQSRSDQWRRDGGQFIPNPATWINQSRWEDEVTAPSQITNNITEEEFFS